MMKKSQKTRDLVKAGATPPDAAATDTAAKQAQDSAKTGARETGGPKGPEPTRYGDWEIKGKCVDF